MGSLGVEDGIHRKGRVINPTPFFPLFCFPLILHEPRSSSPPSRRHRLSVQAALHPPTPCHWPCGPSSSPAWPPPGPLRALPLLFDSDTELTGCRAITDLLMRYSLHAGRHPRSPSRRPPFAIDLRSQPPRQRPGLSSMLIVLL